MKIVIEWWHFGENFIWFVLGWQVVCTKMDNQFSDFDVFQQCLLLFQRHHQFLHQEWICAEWFSSLIVFLFCWVIYPFPSIGFQGRDHILFWDSTMHNALLLPVRLLHQMHCLSLSHSSTNVSAILSFICPFAGTWAFNMASRIIVINTDMYMIKYSSLLLRQKCLQISTV